MSGVTPLLEISDLHVAFGDPAAPTEVLHGVDLTVDAGERVALVGESGSGKSTTALAAMGLLPAGGRVTGGTLRFRGDDLAGAGDDRWRPLRGAEIGLVPQDPMSGLDPVARVGRQVAGTLRRHGRAATRREADEQAVELLDAAGIPDPARRARQYPHELSGGMRQRVLIAIALACRPSLLLADEPTSALDVTVQRRILDQIEEMVAELGTSLLLVTHDLALAAERADRVVVLRDGAVVESGAATELLTAPRAAYTRALVDAVPGDDPLRVRSGTDPDPVLVLDGVTKDFRLRGSRAHVRAVDDVSFTVGAGCTTALVGESGSGKTTAARIALGLVAPTSGSVTLEGTAVSGRDRLSRSARRAAARAMQPVFQDPYASLDPTWSVSSLVAEPLVVHGVGDRATRSRRVGELLDAVALPSAVAGRSPRELSGGQRQRVAIARALALEPRVVVCDEAVSALDVLVQDQVLALLDELRDRLGLSYLFIAHDLGVVRRIADDVVVMRAGVVVEQGPAADVLESPTSDYTRELLAAVPRVAA